MNNYIYILAAVIVVVILVVARILYILGKQDKCLLDIQKELLKEKEESKEFGEALAILQNEYLKLDETLTKAFDKLDETENALTAFKGYNLELNAKYEHLLEQFNMLASNDIPKQEPKQTSKKKAKKKKEDPNLNNTVEEL